jgi:hypothetical protein
LNELQAFLRSDYFPNTLSRQIFLVDTCANYLPVLQYQLPDKVFPSAVGQPNTIREQFVLMAAKPGERAKNLNTEKIGLFSKELLAELIKLPKDEWPPAMETVQARLSQRFIDLREQGNAYQTPTFSYFRDWNCNEGNFLSYCYYLSYLNYFL